MANPFFQFKQFKVGQERCGMKVSADACVLGAFTRLPSAGRILDIGAGTGLLSLMLAQSHPNAFIDAVELDQQAYEQAKENIAASPWTDRIELHPCAIQEFKPAQPYDLIITNPPFYPSHLPSSDPKRKLAFHQESLDFPALVKACATMLAADGICSVLLPVRQAKEFSSMATDFGLYPLHELLLYHSPGHPPHRSITLYHRHQTKSPSVDRLFVRLNDNSYSPAYQQLLQPYYTIF
ncbi:tRNA1(Val) (adenine(37)-N6)-methyltransferase [Nafulsella turpanensis]|uniref:tRNA1(Val) (adenine(37)-N6)-methyltransferase n=1 Tax=Nafulsella turpanensis TaxID=1265690 RepID=UPI00047817B2|nr:methyltransferase [Nafulsella turpanensis]